MREIALDRKAIQNFPKDGPHHSLVSARNKQGRAKVYRTFWEIQGQKIILSTTSKDMHLGLGLIGRDGLDALCFLIETEHRHGAPSEFLINFELGDASLYALRSVEGERVIYSLAPVPTEKHVGH